MVSGSTKGDPMRVYHADHGVSPATLAAVVASVESPGFFLVTRELAVGEPDLANRLWGPSCGDAPVPETEVTYAKRTEDRPLSRLVSWGTRPTRLVTVIGVKGLDDKGTTIFTAYGGPAAEREPGDPSLAAGSPEHAASVAFWATHALAS